MTIDVIIKGGKVVSHRGIEKADIAIRDGIIVAIGELTDISGESEIDATGLHILPGVIDAAFHVKPGFEDETRAAIMGGVTSVLTIAAQAVDANYHSYCDHASFVVADTADTELSQKEKAQDSAGIFLSMVMANGLDAVSGDREILNLLKSANRRVVVHAEDQTIFESGSAVNDVSGHRERHSEKAALEGLRRILAIARGAGTPVHIQHISSAPETAMVAAYKDIATASVSPAHLTLSAPQCYDHFREFVKLDPPVRDEQNRLALWKGVSNGIIDILSSGHSPCGVAEKELEYLKCPSGAPGVQTMLPLMLDQVSKGSLSLQSLMDLTSAGPARTFNIAKKGRIAAGYDADFAIVDLNRKWVLEDDDVISACGWDLYAGCEFTGKVVGTLLRGQTAMWDGDIMSEPGGQSLHFFDNFQEYPDEN